MAVADVVEDVGGGGLGGGFLVVFEGLLVAAFVQAVWARWWWRGGFAGGGGRMRRMRRMARREVGTRKGEPGSLEVRCFATRGGCCCWKQQGRTAAGSVSHGFGT